MTDGAVTVVLGIVLIVVLVASYMRSRRGDDEGSGQPSTSVTDIMRETKEYFGVRGGKEDDGSLIKTFDLGAAELLSGVSRTSAGKRPGKGKGAKKRER